MKVKLIRFQDSIVFSVNVMPSPTGPFWFVRDGNKLKQCSKEVFDEAIRQGKSVKYKGYPCRRVEKIADALEVSRMKLLAKPDLPSKFRSVLTNPVQVIAVQVIDVYDSEFWIRESRNPKYLP